MVATTACSLIKLAWIRRDQLLGFPGLGQFATFLPNLITLTSWRSTPATVRSSLRHELLTLTERPSPTKNSLEESPARYTGFLPASPARAQVDLDEYSAPRQAFDRRMWHAQFRIALPSASHAS